MAEVVVVHGYAGSGKSTQCDRLAKEGLNDTVVRHISIGTRLRAIRTGATASQFSEEIISLLPHVSVPDDIANGVVFESLEEAPEEGLILIDGYPRYKRTVKLFHETLQHGEHEFLGTVFFWISRETSLDRVLGRGLREGDRIKHNDFETNARYRYNRDAQTLPRTLKALGAFALVEEIDASGNKHQVHSRFKAAVGRLAVQRANVQV